jgi:hypothetical protein
VHPYVSIGCEFSGGSPEAELAQIIDPTFTRISQPSNHYVIDT